MAKYQVSGIIDGTNIKTVTKKVTDVFGEQLTVKKIEPATSRADRLGEAERMIEDAKQIVEELYDEMEQWRDSIPENLQGGEKYQEVEAAADALDSIKDSLQDVDLSNVEFPGMF